MVLAAGVYAAAVRDAACTSQRRRSAFNFLDVEAVENCSLVKVLDLCS